MQKDGMRPLYRVLFPVFFWLAAPYYFWRLVRRGNWWENFGQRFGRFGPRIKQSLTNRQVLWLHAVSVGEVNLCTQLIQALEPRLPNLKIVVSTTTTTGMAELKRRLPAHILTIYYPIDFYRSVQRALSIIHPEAIVLVEAEIWPHFLMQARRRRIPVFLANARLSDRSFRGYQRFGFMFRSLFASLAGVGAQTEADAGRLRDLGCRPETIHVIGNLKFDAARLIERRLLDVPSMLRQLGVAEGARLLLGGSTHAGEEALLAEQFLRLRPQFPDLFLVLVPRHFERGKSIGKELAARGVRFVYRSEVTNNTQHPPGAVDCLLVNSTGELKLFYEYATVIFVGKSLAAQGGQNPIEPGALGKAMVFGPHMQNFAAIAAAFVGRKGAIQVRQAAELEPAIRTLLADNRLREELGRNALKVVQENRGAVDRTVDMILTSLKGEDLYIRTESAGPHPGKSP